MRHIALLLLFLGVTAALFGQGGARATAWGHRTPGQVDVPQDKDLSYYIDNVWTLEVTGKNAAQTKTESGAYTCFVALANCVVNNVKHMKILSVKRFRGRPDEMKQELCDFWREWVRWQR